ncbi:MAG: HAD family phosphatase [Paludibacteraceae bacterium]|nr:HAD family phosphatase [Paludibacteraceae bacterium]
MPNTAIPVPKAPIQLVALDIDGTLADSHKNISETNIAELDRIQQAGVKVALVSGRPTYGILPTARKIHLEQFGGYILAFNGAKITQADTQEVLYENALAPSMIPAIYEAAKELKAEIITYSDGAILSENPSYKYVQREAQINKMPTCEVRNLVEATIFHTPKCLLLAEPDHLAMVEKEMQRRFKGLSIYRSEPYFLEIVPQGIDKSESLNRLTAMIGCTMEQLLACGDGYNDMTMVRDAGIGVAMQNAQNEVKAVAAWVSPLTNDQDAVADAIRRFVP